MIDHRASPGTPQVPEGSMFEAATLRCAHCPHIVIINPSRTRERASCAKCGGHYVCDNCALEMKLPGYTHTPYNQKIENIYNEGLKLSNG